MQPEDYIQINKRHWDAIAVRNRPEKLEVLRQVKEDASYLEKWEPRIAPYLREIAGKRIIVPQFGDGHLMLACARKGAIVTGVDLSGEQVRFVKKAAAYCDVNVELVEADCQKLPKSIPNNHFDLAIAECGIFIWISNIEAWMKNAYRVLKTGGRVIVSDFHPLSMIAEEKEGVITFTKSYFDQQPKVYQPEKNAPPAVEFLWKLSDIINAAVEAGFRIDRVEEFYVEKSDEKIPLIPTDFLLVATKGN